jgi:Zn-dependent protease with chaperone function
VIVVTDELLLSMADEDEVVAVLAHELGHAQNRHFLRSLLAHSATAAVAGLFTGDVSSVAGGSGAALVLARNEYSREFEREADAFAVAELSRAKLSPLLFATALERLEADAQTEDHDSPWTWLATHPSFPERIAAARAAASAAAATPEHR